MGGLLVVKEKISERQLSWLYPVFTLTHYSKREQISLIFPSPRPGESLPLVPATLAPHLVARPALPVVPVCPGSPPLSGCFHRAPVPPVHKRSRRRSQPR